MIFLSHSWRDKPEARRVVEELTSNRVPVWLDEQQLTSGAELCASLLDAITKSAVYLYLVSAKANESKWVQRELDFALGLEMEGKIKIVPVLMAQSSDKLPPKLTGRLYNSLDTSAGGATRLAHELGLMSGALSVPRACRLTATVRLKPGGVRHTLAEARSFVHGNEINFLFLNQDYERIDSLYWKVSEQQFPPVQGSREQLEGATSVVEGLHRQCRAAIDAARRLSAQYIALAPDSPYFRYFQSGIELELEMLLHRVSWVSQYLKKLSDRGEMDKAFLDARELPESFDGHLCDFVSGEKLIGKVKVPKHGHPFSDDAPLYPWGLTSPFSDLTQEEVGKAVGRAVAMRLLAGTLESAGLPDPKTLRYGLS